MVQTKSARPARMMTVASSGAMWGRSIATLPLPHQQADLVDGADRRTAAALAQVLVDHVPVVGSIAAALHQPFAADDERGNSADAERFGLLGGIGHRVLERFVVERLDEALQIETHPGSQFQLHVAAGDVDAL